MTAHQIRVSMAAALMKSTLLRANVSLGMLEDVVKKVLSQEN